MAIYFCEIMPQQEQPNFLHYLVLCDVMTSANLPIEVKNLQEQLHKCSIVVHTQIILLTGTNTILVVATKPLGTYFVDRDRHDDSRILKKHFAYPTMNHLGSAPNTPSASAKIMQTLDSPIDVSKNDASLSSNPARVVATITIPLTKQVPKRNQGSLRRPRSSQATILTLCVKFKKLKYQNLVSIHYSTESE